MVINKEFIKHELDKFPYYYKNKKFPSGLEGDKGTGTSYRSFYDPSEPDKDKRVLRTAENVDRMEEDAKRRIAKELKYK